MIFRVAIVGMGPKGLYCLERLIAEFNARPASDSLRIGVFNRSSRFGASPVYDPAQPDYVLVNIKVGEINLWEADNPPVVAQGGMDFVSWHHAKFNSDFRLTGEEYLPRALVGEYLVEGFRRILDQLPPAVTVTCHTGEVTDIDPGSCGYAVTWVTDGREETGHFDKILLATGHSRVRPGRQESSWARLAARHDHLRFIPFVYPVEKRTAGIPPGTTVATMGIGLTFIDAVLALTEGRGGSFRRTPDGLLDYSPSGREPGRILPFSRSGLPMSPKSDDLPINPPKLSLVTTQALESLRRKSPGGKLDLGEVWPLCVLEMELHYYRAVMARGTDREGLESAAADPGLLREFIDRYLQDHPFVERFDYRKVLDPVAGLGIETGAQFHKFIEQYMEREIARARLGQSGSPVKAAIEVWYQVRGTLGEFIKNAGFTPDSHRTMIEELFPRFKRVAFGPPRINIEKLLALLRAGLVDFSLARNPRLSLNQTSGRYELRSRTVPEKTVSAETFMDARFPPVDVSNDATSLMRNLTSRGMIRPLENRDGAESAPYRPGAIDMTYPFQFVVNEAGAPNRDIAVIGIPTEGNLIGNLTMARDDFAALWAAETMRQLRATGR